MVLVWPVGDRNNRGDDGAAQMLLELKLPFDVIDPSVVFEAYRLIILPDDIPVDATLAGRLAAFVAAGGKLILSGTSGLNPDGSFALDAGIRSYAHFSSHQHAPDDPAAAALGAGQR